MKKFLLLISLFTTIAFAQDKVQISGKVLDGEMDNEPLLGATVLISGTTTGTQTDFDGNYILEVYPGTYTLEYSYVGYNSTKENIILSANKTINKTLEANSLEQIVIVAQTNREKESTLLITQKKAIEIKQQIGAQELAKKGISDVATAITKVSGISKQEGSNAIFVRGLGDRYNSTTLNGLPLPSNNPSRKNISLDIFSTDIVEYIDVNKIYHNKIYGDFGGANVNIISKNHHGKGSLKIGYGSGYNFNAINEDKFYLQDGPNYFGFSNQKQPNNPLSGYNFTTSLDRETKSPFNQSFSLTGGIKFDFKNNHRLSVFTTTSFSNNFSYVEGVTKGGVTTDGVARSDYLYESFSYKTNTTGMLNLAYRFNRNNTIKTNSLFINSSNKNLSDYSGTIDNFDNAENGGGFIRRSTFNKTQLIVNQLLGDHKINDRINLNWALGYNYVLNNTPDRRQIMLVPTDNNNPLTSPKTVSDISDSNSHRYFEELNENEFATNIESSYRFSKNEDNEYKGKFSFGYSGRFKTVDLEATQFNFAINRTINQPNVDVNNLDAYFNQANLTAGYFKIKTFRGGLNIQNALDPQTYNGTQTINSGYGNIQYSINSKLITIIGLRAEHVTQEIEWMTSLDPEGDKNSFDKVEIMPNTSFKYELTEKQNLKLAGSKSYTLPQFKERAPFLYEDVEGSKYGNPNLYPSTNYNADLRWEYFPKSGEVISITGFGKLIQNPINEVIIASAANDISWVNSGKQATIYGAELEFKKDIINRTRTKEELELTNKLTFGFNGAFMVSDQDFDKKKVTTENDLTVNFTNDNGKLTGASEVLLNGDISFFKEFSKHGNLSTTIVGNYSSESVYAIGSAGKGNLVNEGFFTMDIILKSKISKRISAGVSIKNILDSKIKRYQDNETGKVSVKSFKKGVNASLSLKYDLF